MCYRFAYGDVEKSLKKYRVQLSQESLDRLGDPFNVYPSDFAPIIMNKPNTVSEELIADTYKWGLIPFWAIDAKIGSKLFNARVETLYEKPSFKESFKTKRCVVPAVGFYETWRDGNTKKPYYFSFKEEKPFSLAGLYSIWNDIKTFTIVTMPAIGSVKSIHDRMPLILAGDEYKFWLDGGDETEILGLLLKNDYSLKLIKHAQS